jgi:hypothetical protein
MTASPKKVTASALSMRNATDLRSAQAKGRIGHDD